MEIKKIIPYTLTLLAGLLIGYFVFNKQQLATDHAGHQEASSPANAEQVYTCSMHPQIRQNEPGICPICEMDLIPLTTNSSNDPTILQMTEEAVKLASIQTTRVGVNNDSNSNSKSIPLSGRVQVDERRASSLVAHVPGRIEKLYISFKGEAVKEGQKLADIYSPELITAQRELIEAVKLKELNPSLLEATRNKLRFWKIGAQTISNIETSGQIQESFTVYAEASGIVNNRRVAVGDYIKKGAPLFDLINLQKVWVLFDAYEKDLPQISVGDLIEFTSPSVPDKTFKTRISFIDPIINPNTRVASVRAEVSNKNGRLKPEQFVNGIIKKSISSKSTPLSIPKSAVLWTGKRSVVYVKVPDTEIPSFQFREIELGQSLGDHYQINSGLDANEEIVTYGSFAIDAAAQLNNQASMMNKDISIKKEANELTPNFKVETPPAFQQQLKNTTTAYLQLKDALVGTQPAEASEAAKNILTQLDQIDMSLLKGEAHLYWMEQLEALTAHSKKLSTLNDVEEQRQQFQFISEALIKSIEAFGITGDSVYVQYCPMAFDNAGADWLSNEDLIQNPYFGDKMMKCGSVKKIIN